jgi:hypothetical protein
VVFCSASSSVEDYVHVLPFTAIKFLSTQASTGEVELISLVEDKLV